MSKQLPDRSVPFVGRKVELSKLHGALEKAMTTASPVFAFIQADYGVGKTTLVDRFLAEAIEKHPHLLIGQGRCALESETSGLVPFTQVLASLTKPDNQRGVMSQEWLEFIRQIAPAWIDVFTAGIVGATLKTVEESRKLLDSREFTQESVFNQFTNAIVRLAEKQPIVAFVDDLHWADASSLRLLFHLQRTLKDRAMLFIATYRPVEAMETGANAPLFREIRANLIRYGALIQELEKGIDVSTYIAQRYPLNLFPSNLAERIGQATDGHALFVSQLFALWEENGLVSPQPGSEDRPVWQFDPKADVQIELPQTMSEVLDERIRQMTDALRATLVCASIEGDEFTLQTVAQLRQINELQVNDELEALEHRYNLLREEGTKQIDGKVLDLYRFSHRFFQEHVYKHISAYRRRALHKQVGECLEALVVDRREMAGQLVHHFREARELTKAAQYALLAAQFEQARYAWAEGARWCETGLTLAKQMPASSATLRLQFDLLEQSGNCYYHSANYVLAHEQYVMALSLAESLSKSAESIAGIYFRLSEMCDWRELSSEAMIFVQQGQAILEEQTVPRGDLFFLLEAQRAWLEYRQGKSKLAVNILRQILTDLDNLPPTHQLKKSKAEVYIVLGLVLSSLNEYREAVAASLKAIEIARTNSSMAHLLSTAWIFFRSGDLKESMNYAIQGAEVATQVGNRDDMAEANSIIGEILLARGRFQEAIDKLIQAIALSAEIEVLSEMSYMYASLALAHVALSDRDAAHLNATQALTYAMQAGVPFKSAYALDALGQVEVVLPDWDSAELHFKQAIATFQEIGDRHYAARSQRHLAELRLRQGKQAEAVALLQTALQLFQELGLAHEIGPTQALLDGIG